jgi:SAM-dependent methyltransferase
VFRADRAVINERAVAEAARVLKPGGKFVLFNCGPEQAAAGEQILSRHFVSHELQSPNAWGILRQKWNVFRYARSNPNVYFTRYAVGAISYIGTKGAA